MADVLSDEHDRWTAFVRALRRGDVVEDREFNEIYPREIRRKAERHWTPVSVARRAAELLAIRGTRILDVGAGVGKFCMIAGLTTKCEIVGVEQRPHLLSIAKDCAERLRIPRTEFICANAFSLDWSDFDAFYLFNPFVEHVIGVEHVIDENLIRDPLLYRSYIEQTQSQLLCAREGTSVVTYHGFGGRLPSCYRCFHQETVGTDELELWVKQSTVMFVPSSGKQRGDASREWSCCRA